MFSEPPINLIKGLISDKEITFDSKLHFPVHEDLGNLAPGEYHFGVRPSHISLSPHSDDDLEVGVTVELAEISGSETFLHVRNDLFDMVVHLAGVHEFDEDQRINIYFPPHKVYAFDRQGAVVHIPSHLGGV